MFRLVDSHCIGSTEGCDSDGFITVAITIVNGSFAISVATHFGGFYYTLHSSKIAQFGACKVYYDRICYFVRKCASVGRNTRQRSGNFKLVVCRIVVSPATNPLTGTRAIHGHRFAVRECNFQIGHLAGGLQVAGWVDRNISHLYCAFHAFIVDFVILKRNDAIRQTIAQRGRISNQYLPICLCSLPCLRQ
jgi:hypothetical protein